MRKVFACGILLLFPTVIQSWVPPRCNTWQYYSQRILFQQQLKLYEEENSIDEQLFSNDSFVDDAKRRTLWQSTVASAFGCCSGNVNSHPASAVEMALANRFGVETPTAGETAGNTNTGTPAPTIPFSSVRNTKVIRMNTNGLQVLLVRDARARQSSAALCIAGAGQFADGNLPGLAHLMEHMILSSPVVATAAAANPSRDDDDDGTSRRPTNGSKQQPSPAAMDFEDWIAEYDGASNAFTAYDCVCFHFVCPHSVLAEALGRFAPLFYPSVAVRTVRNRNILAREVRRVDAELDLDDASMQSAYLTKDFVFDNNNAHPYARFSRGNLQSLERDPQAAGIDVGQALVQFFQSKYRADRATLVIVSPQEHFAQERWIAPFSMAFMPPLAATPPTAPATTATTAPVVRNYPGGFLSGTRLKHMVLYCKNPEEENRINFQWILNLDYSKSTPPPVSATSVAFCLAQLLGRRGPGSLYQYLLRRDWIFHPTNNSGGTNGSIRVSLPVDVSQFQLLRLQIALTPEGMANRDGVVAAVYSAMERLRSSSSSAAASYKIPRQDIRQFMNIAKLHGYILAPRPPDAVEMAVDAQQFGLETVASGKWYRTGGAETIGGTQILQRTLAGVLETMGDPESAVIIALASSKRLAASSSVSSYSLPPLSSPKWLKEPVTGGSFLFENMLKRTAGVERLALSRLLSEEELTGPVLNPLVPATIRPARSTASLDGSCSSSNQNERIVVSPFEYTTKSWKLLGDNLPKCQMGVVLPRCPPEPSCRSLFVLELLSPRPARANVRQAAYAELWRLSFEKASADLAELGAPGALAYEVSFNKFGLRIGFLGISQTLPSYARRISRALVQHAYTLLQGPEMLPTSLTSRAVSTAKRMPGVSITRRLPLISNLRSATAYNAAAEGIAFLRSCSGAVAFAQGDLLPTEASSLLEDLQEIFYPAVATIILVKASSGTDSAAQNTKGDNAEMMAKNRERVDGTKMMRSDERSGAATKSTCPTKPEFLRGNCVVRPDRHTKIPHENEISPFFSDTLPDSSESDGATPENDRSVEILFHQTRDVGVEEEATNDTSEISPVFVCEDSSDSCRTHVADTASSSTPEEADNYPVEVFLRQSRGLLQTGVQSKFPDGSEVGHEGIRMTWKPATTPYLEVALSSDEDEYQDVARFFSATVPYLVVSIHRIQNTHLWHRYHKKRNRLAKLPRNKGFANEDYLWYGRQNFAELDTILKDGPRRGEGVWMSTNSAHYCSSSFLSPAVPIETRKLILMRTSLGTMGYNNDNNWSRSSSRRRWFAKNNDMDSHHDGYSSGHERVDDQVGGNPKSSNLYRVDQVDQVYPAYVVEFLW